MSRREFHFREGASNKFWAIAVEGNKLTVEFGRIGTKGQTQEKEFDSEEEARQAADKLIAEKTKKGYTEAGAAATTSTASGSPKVKARIKEQLAEPVSPSPPVTPTITRTIELEPHDWLWSTWRPRDRYVVPAPQTRPFDREECVKQFLAQVKPRSDGWWDWEKVKLRQPISPEEAHFWAVAVTSTEPKHRPDGLADKLVRQDFDGHVTPADIDFWVRGMKQKWDAQFVLLWQTISVLLSPERFLELILEPSSLDIRGPYALNCFREAIWPHLTSGQVEKLNPLLRDRLDPADWDDSAQSPRALVFLLGALLGMHEEMLALVNSWSDGRYSNYHSYYFAYSWVHPQRIVLGLGDAKQMDHHMRRLGLHLWTPTQVRAWLANTELAGLDLVSDSILQLKREHAEKLLEVFSLVKAPEVAPHMLELKLASKAPALARQWLDENPGNAIAGLIPVASERGKLAEAALDYLREAKHKGYAAFIEEQLRSATPETAEKVRQEVLHRVEVIREPFDEATTPAWLKTALKSEAKTSILPDWLRPTNILPLLVGERRLNDTQVTAVLSALRHSQLGRRTPLVKAIREHVDSAVRDAFAWRLFELWLSEGTPAKEKWALLAVGHLGGDASALKLTPLLRAWPGESQHQRAVTGLACLCAIRSDTALMQLNSIAQKLKFKGLQNKAREFMDAIAADRGLSRAELEDRIVPDLDLDERGGRTFDFGPRRFRFVLGPDLKPLLRDEAGQLKDDLPKPGAKDDASKAVAALEQWRVLKKQVREAAKVQSFRLEQAMVTGRRWSVDEFERLLVRHPLLTNLVQRLLWSGYDKQGKLVVTFRVTEEREYADRHDSACTLKGVVAVGIVHPLHLSEEERSAWGKVLGDYEIISPFPQLGRAIHHLDPKEDQGRDITRFAKTKVPGVSVASFLEKAGWMRGPLQDHGDFHEYYKRFPSAQVTAVVEVEPGLWAGNIADPQEQQLPRCFFRQGLVVPDWYDNRKNDTDIILGKVDPVVMSEVLADLTALASKGQ